MKNKANEIKKMVRSFQCPGCMLGMSTNCGSYKYDENELRCVSHVLGTIKMGAGHFALGLPKGFCRPGFADKGTKSKIDVRLWLKGEAPTWDKVNVPVWAMEQDGFLFVRTFCPRINFSWVDVVQGGTMDMVPTAMNVKDFIDEID